MGMEEEVFKESKLERELLDSNFIEGVFRREDDTYRAGQPMKHHEVPGEDWPTKYGITYKFFGKKSGFTRSQLDEKVRDLTEDQAVELYKKNNLANARYIWGGSGGSEYITYKLTDIGINAGPQLSTEIMQRSINQYLDLTKQSDKKVTVDGKWSKGGETDKIYKAILNVGGKSAETDLMNIIINQQHLFYSGSDEFKTKQVSNEQAQSYYWGDTTPGQGKAMGGWATRANYNPLPANYIGN